MSHSKIPDGIFMFPTTSEGLPSSPLGKKRELDEEAVEAVDTIPPPPLWTSSKASFALGAPLKKKVRRSEDTRSDTPPRWPPVKTSDRVLGPTREAAVLTTMAAMRLLTFLSLLRVILIHYDRYAHFHWL